MNESSTHWVYEIWWEHNQICLYVGMTGNLKRRIGDHKRQQMWWKAAPVTVRVTECSDRLSAERLEMKTIRTLNPANNVVGNLRLEEYGRALAQQAPPITAEQAEAAARILASVETEAA